MIEFLSSVWGIALKIVIAAVIFLIGLIIGKFAGMIITKLLYELQIDQILETIGIKFFFSNAVGNLASFIIYISGIVLALRQIGLEKIMTWVLIGIFSVILAIFLFFGITDALRNFFAGAYIKEKFSGMSKIENKIVKGKIINVGNTGIRVLTDEKDVVFVPFIALVKE